MNSGLASGNSADAVVATDAPAVVAAVEENLPAPPGASAGDVPSPARFAGRQIRQWRDRAVHAWESLPDSGGRPESIGMTNQGVIGMHPVQRLAPFGIPEGGEK